MTDQIFKGGVTKTTNTIIQIAAFVGAVTVIAGGYTWYLNNFWKPKITVVSTDFNNGTAEFTYKGENYHIDGDAVYWLNGDWGIRLGQVIKDNTYYYDRIELLKKGMVVEYLQ
jgi:hypothetical protein